MKARSYTWTAPKSRSSRGVALLLILAVAVSLGLAGPADAEGPSPALELTRTVRPWEFLSSVGRRAGLFGNEAGNFEAWVILLKILRDFHLKFLVDGRAVPAEALARTLTVRPESSTILYTGDTFAVRETFFVPVQEPGAVISLEIETAQPLDVQVVFERDLPTGMAGCFGRNVFLLGPETERLPLWRRAEEIRCLSLAPPRPVKSSRNTTPTIRVRRKTHSAWVSSAKAKPPKSS